MCTETLPTSHDDDDRVAAQAAYTELSRPVTALIDAHLRQNYPDWPGSLVLQRSTVSTIVALLTQQQRRMATREAAAVLAVLQGALEREVPA